MSNEQRIKHLENVIDTYTVRMDSAARSSSSNPHTQAALDVEINECSATIDGAWKELAALGVERKWYE